VFGTFPVSEDPKSEVIWEAFQPQTEPRRSLHGSMGDPYQEQPMQQVVASTAPQQPQRPAPGPRPGFVNPPGTIPEPQTATRSLPTQNAVQ
jgi:penicillin-binding protein 1A